MAFIIFLNIESMFYREAKQEKQMNRLQNF